MPSLIESKFRLDDPPFVSYNQKKNDYIRIAMNPGSSGRLNTGGDLIFEVDNQQSYLYLPDSFYLVNILYIIMPTFKHLYQLLIILHWKIISFQDYSRKCV